MCIPKATTVPTAGAPAAPPVDPTPSVLGTGMAGKAAKDLLTIKARRDKQISDAGG